MDNPTTGRVGRRCLVFDTNVASGSYKDFRTIDFDVTKDKPEDQAAAIHRWPVTSKECRRVIAKVKAGGKDMDMVQMNKTALTLMSEFKNGQLVLEDMNHYLYGAAQMAFYSQLIRVRHKSVDLTLIVQSLGVVDPRMWINSAYLRMHKCIDSVDRIKKRVGSDRFKILKIAELIVDAQYDAGNKRYFVYVDLRDTKIIGVTKEKTMTDAIKKFINFEQGELKRFCQNRDLDPKKDLAKAKELFIKQTLEEIWVNPTSNK